MGSIYNAFCNECSFNKRVMLGAGLNSVNISFLVRLADVKDRKAIEAMQDNKDIQFIVGETCLTRCECGGADTALEEKLIITVTDKAQRVHIFGRECAHCGQALTVYENAGSNELTKVPCPKCGDQLAFERTGHWD